MSDQNLIAVWLYRHDWGGSDEWYGSTRSIPGASNHVVIGVAFREPFETISGESDRDAFEGNVERVAESVRWFDDEVST